MPNKPRISPTVIAAYMDLQKARGKLYRAEDIFAHKEKMFKDECYKLAKTDNLDFSSVACVSGIVSHHVYKLTSDYWTKGNGNWTCIFCGCDDFDL